MQGWCGVATENGVIRVGFNEKVTFEQRGGDEGVSHGMREGRTSRGRKQPVQRPGVV